MGKLGKAVNNVIQQAQAMMQAPSQTLSSATVTTGTTYLPGQMVNAYGSGSSISSPTITYPYPPQQTVGVELMLSLMTLMYVVGPDTARRLFKKFSLPVDNDLVEKIADGIKQLNNNTNDLDQVVNECAEELKI